MERIFKLLKLIFIVLPIAIVYGICIAFITLVEHIIDQSRIR